MYTRLAEVGNAGRRLARIRRLAGCITAGWRDFAVRRTQVGPVGLRASSLKIHGSTTRIDVHLRTEGLWTTKVAVLHLRGVVGVATEPELGLGKARAIALAAQEQSLRRALARRQDGQRRRRRTRNVPGRRRRESSRVAVEHRDHEHEPIKARQRRSQHAPGTQQRACVPRQEPREKQRDATQGTPRQATCGLRRLPCSIGSTPPSLSAVSYFFLAHAST